MDRNKTIFYKINHYTQRRPAGIVLIESLQIDNIKNKTNGAMIIDMLVVLDKNITEQITLTHSNYLSGLTKIRIIDGKDVYMETRIYKKICIESDLMFESQLVVFMDMELVSSQIVCMISQDMLEKID